MAQIGFRVPLDFGLSSKHPARICLYDYHDTSGKDTWQPTHGKAERLSLSIDRAKYYARPRRLPSWHDLLLLRKNLKGLMRMQDPVSPSPRLRWLHTTQSPNTSQPCVLVLLRHVALSGCSLQTPGVLRDCDVEQYKRDSVHRTTRTLQASGFGADLRSRPQLTAAMVKAALELQHARLRSF